MSTTPDSESSAERSWLWEHIGRLAGAVLGLLGTGFVVLLAALGYRPAIALLVVAITGFILIAAGGRLHKL